MKLFPLKLAIILLFILTYNIKTEAQKSDAAKRNEFLHRLSVSGHFGFQFGSITGILVSPEVKIRAVDQLYFGTGFIYQYIRWKNEFYDLSTNQELNLSLNIFGGRIFTRYYLGSLFNSEILGNFFVHAEYEYLTYTFPYTRTQDGSGQIIDYNFNNYKNQKQIVEINSLFVGGGYKQPISKTVFMDLLILFNLNETYNSPYSNPIIRIGVGANL